MSIASHRFVCYLRWWTGAITEADSRANSTENGNKKKSLRYGNNSTAWQRRREMFTNSLCYVNFNLFSRSRPTIEEVVRIWRYRNWQNTTKTLCSTGMRFQMENNARFTRSAARFCGREHLQHKLIEVYWRLSFVCLFGFFQREERKRIIGFNPEVDKRAVSLRVTSTMFSWGFENLL